ncbi:hypothetical protein IMZ11_00855 [Microtetraspora sp. AC03309]|uniref:hypothetical protein n=1 Tax=Microtetraspora sp. AC03309 TaxID=2779376 RepID=UPI001E341839|nr:hypothetical protein [Microtetraspora sp. AC03309]MCC5574189.1 hypothetical protein [Microtetraspora sp. AC03309]
MRRENDREQHIVNGFWRDTEIDYEPDFAEEHTPSETDPANARASDGMPDERWDKPTEV